MFEKLTSIFNRAKKVQVRGIDLINVVTDRFEEMISELQSGVEDCVSERDELQSQVSLINQRQKLLDSAISKAQAVSHNLSKLLDGNEEED